MSSVLRTRVRFEAEPIKGSRFIATAAPATTEAEAQALLAEIATEWPDASHHCWAWRIATPPIERAGDDGEPGGSAGRPMLAVLVGRDLVDTAVIVTRWFGGTKLGVGGLVRAYGGTAAQALDGASFDPWVAMELVTIRHDHSDTTAVDRALSGVDATVLDTDWGVDVVRTVSVPVSQVAQLWSDLADATQGRLSLPRPGA